MVGDASYASYSPAMDRSRALALVFSLIGAAILLALLEGAIALALRTSPGSGPAAFERARRTWYLEHERSIVQYQPACAEHDPALGYRLPPGRRPRPEGSKAVGKSVAESAAEGYISVVSR